MTLDLGRPFSRPYESLIGSLEQRIREGVEQPGRTRVLFRSATSGYDLPTEVFDVVRVSGLAGGRFTVFAQGADYRFANGQILWSTTGALPDDLSRFEVEYTFLDRPAGLTDFNPGSVVGTLVRVFARELKLLYEQMDEAYRRAFIDEASGVALDNVVALLNVRRNPAQKALGRVVFLRKRAATTTVTIAAGTRVATESKRVFATLSSVEIPLQREELLVPSGTELRVDEKVAEVVGVWPKDDDPEVDPALILAAPPPDPEFGADGRTISLDAAPPAGELRVRYKPRSATAEIEAMEAGPDGNVNSGAIVIMPTPPPGVDQGVDNEEPTTGGLSAENDEALRERARHELERAGKATLNAIKFAVLDVDGVEGVEVIDHTVEETVPLGEVRVRHSGGDPVEILQVVEETRAAGIMARLEGIQPVLVSGTWLVILEEGASPAATAEFAATVSDAMKALHIGEPLSVRRLNALAFRVPGLADVAEAQLRYHRVAGTPAPADADLPDPYLTLPIELVRPDTPAIRVEPIRLPATLVSRRAGSTNEIDLRFVKPDASAATFRSFTLDLTLTFKARLQSTPDEPPERIRSLTRRVTLTSADLLTIIVPDGDVLDLPGNPGFRTGDHDPAVEVVIEAAAYPGMGSAKAQATLPA